jgi:selenium-binding protein 1
MLQRFGFKRQILILGAALTLMALLVAPVAAAGGGFEHGIVVDVDGEAYYFAGAPDGPDGAFDIPGHYWVQAGPRQLVGKHYNTGPFGAPMWWSSDADDGELLYIVHAIIDTWSMEKAEAYAERGYVHYHELISVDDGSLHPDKVVWLKHTARTSFNFDGGPHPELAHEVTPGVDYDFIPNGMMPYNP